MRKSIGHTALECILDLGITVVYATLAGVVIAAILASDDGPVSVFKTALYASLLPASVILMIFIDLVLRLMADARSARRRTFARHI